MTSVETAGMCFGMHVCGCHLVQNANIALLRKVERYKNLLIQNTHGLEDLYGHIAIYGHDDPTIFW